MFLLKKKISHQNTKNLTPKPNTHKPPNNQKNNQNKYRVRNALFFFYKKKKREKGYLQPNFGKNQPQSQNKSNKPTALRNQLRDLKIYLRDLRSTKKLIILLEYISVSCFVFVSEKIMVNIDIFILVDMRNNIKKNI